MTSKVSFLAMMMAVICAFTSCLSDNTVTVTTYDDVAITSFTLGTVNCRRTVKSKTDGKDSTYTYTYTGSSFPVSIDQRNNSIYNEDSLTVGSDMSHILVTIDTKNSGYVAFKELGTDNYVGYTSTDSVDLSQKRTLTVFSNDGQHRRDYIVDIRVHKEHPDSFSWDAINNDIASEIATYSKMKAVATNDRVFLLGINGSNNSIYTTNNGNDWTKCSGITVTDDASIAVYNGKAYVLSGAKLYASEDGQTWDNVNSDNALATIVGGVICKDDKGNVTCKELYATVANGAFMKSTNDGATWDYDDIESNKYYDNSKYLPVSDINFVTTPLRSNSGMEYATVIANKTLEYIEKDTISISWTKIVDADAPQPWTYTQPVWHNHQYLLPRMNAISATYYADGIIAIGTTPKGSTTKAFSQIYYSPDKGATWHTDNYFKMPADFTATDAAVIVADNKGYIYIISDGTADADGVKKGQIWKGRKNSETWQKATL